MGSVGCTLCISSIILYSIHFVNSNGMTYVSGEKRSYSIEYTLIIPLTQARISQIYDMQNIFIKIPIVFGSDWPLPSRSNTTLNEISFIPGSITRVNTQEIHYSSVYLDCFISLPASRSTSSAHTYMPRLLHSSDCSTVSTFCTDNDLGSRVYIGMYRFSCFVPPTELGGGT